MITSLYAAAWLVVLLMPLVCFIVSSRLGLERKYNIRYLWVLAGLAVWLLLNGLILSSDTPGLLCALAVTVYLILLPFVGGKKISLLTNIGLRTGVYGTLLLSLLFYLVVDMDGNIGARQSKRYQWWAERNTINRDRAFNVNLRALAQDDSTDYPAGKLTPDHPLWQKYPVLREPPLITGATSYWHSFFTRIMRCQYAPVRTYPGWPPSMNVPDTAAIWEELLNREAGLDFGYDSWGYSELFDLVRSGQSDKLLWHDFISSDSRNSLMNFLVERLKSERMTTIRAFVFGNITEGQLAVFGMQRLSGRNFDEYYGSNPVIRAHLREDGEHKRILYLQPLREILTDAGARRELAFYLSSR